MAIFFNCVKVPQDGGAIYVNITISLSFVSRTFSTLSTLSLYSLLSTLSLSLSFSLSSLIFPLSPTLFPLCLSCTHNHSYFSSLPTFLPLSFLPSLSSPSLPPLFLPPPLPPPLYFPLLPFLSPLLYISHLLPFLSLPSSSIFPPSCPPPLPFPSPSHFLRPSPW